MIREIDNFNEVMNSDKVTNICSCGCACEKGWNYFATGPVSTSFVFVMGLEMFEKLDEEALGKKSIQSDKCK